MDEATKRSKAPDSAYLFLQSDRPLFASGCVRWTVHSQSSIAWIFSHRCVPITQFAKCFSGPNLLENRTMWVWLKNRQKSRLCPNKKRDQKVTMHCSPSSTHTQDTHGFKHNLQLSHPEKGERWWKPGWKKPRMDTAKVFFHVFLTREAKILLFLKYSLVLTKPFLRFHAKNFSMSTKCF